MKYALKRLREPSTLAGLGGLALLFGVPPGTVDVTVQAIAALLSAAAVFVPDTK